MANQQENIRHDFEECIENCIECHRVCLETMQYCLRLGGEHAAMTHIRLLADCAQICQTSDRWFMMRGSELHEEICAACAEVCSRCGHNCALVDADDAQMQECAEICLRCATTCGEMAGEWSWNTKLRLMGIDYVMKLKGRDGNPLGRRKVRKPILTRYS